MKVLVAILSLVVMVGCNLQEDQPKYKIGFSQCIGPEGDLWREQMINEMNREMFFHDDLELEIMIAERSNERQVKQIEEFIAKGIDLLIVSPFEAEPIAAVVDKAFLSGIPVIFIDRKTTSNYYTAYVGPDNYRIGQIAAQVGLNILKSSARSTMGQTKILEVHGQEKASPFGDRHIGFMEVIEKDGSYEVITIGDPPGWPKELQKIVSEEPDIQLIYTHVDPYGHSAHLALKELDLDREVPIIGIDGLSGPTGGMQMVLDGVLAATILYPTGGDRAIQLASDILNGRPYQRNNELVTTVIDKGNVQVLMQQANKINTQQNDISRLNDKIREQISIYKNQRNLIYIFGATLVLLILLSAYVFKSAVEKQRTNGRLREQNAEILKQKDKVLEMSRKANEAHQAKVKFFTNLSHEFRTPLTLIFGPVEKLMKGLSDSPLKREVALIRENGNRLLRLVNQLMEFRKIENGKLKLHVSEINMVSFLEEIMDAFKDMAERRNIDFRLLSHERSISVWIDQNMLDKVFFNLLNNAFKFVQDYGKIHVYIELDQLREQVVVRFKDNGVGMSTRDAEKIFDRFYQVDQKKMKGTGLGLALSKELIVLHGAAISVESELNRGTCFTIGMKLGNSHFKQSEIVPSGEMPIIDRSDSIISYQDHHEYKPEHFTGTHETSILLVEDNQELRRYLMENLQDHYDVYEAISGEAGFRMASHEVPDIIITDIGLEGMNGFELIKRLKNDQKTSHIPIIVLSAKDDLSDRIKGIKYGADDYITKPFSLQYLLERISTLLINTQKLREHYLHELPTEKVTNHGKLDRKFVNEFTSTVEQHLANPDLDVKILCGLLGLSKIQLYRKVKATMGYNVNEYINQVRLKLARHLLLNDDVTMSEIAHKIGYSSPSYFATVFKTQFGMTPTEFRNNKGKFDFDTVTKN